MRKHLVILAFLAGCNDPIEEAVPGHLAHVTVTTWSDSCDAGRSTGDGGIQFFGVRSDGGIAFTLPQDLIFGPLIDGGALESVQRQSHPIVGNGKSNVGAPLDGTVDDQCEGIFTAWVPIDGGFKNDQEFPGLDKCETGPLWLPQKACTVSRTYEFSPISDCDLKCVKVSASTDVTCDC